MIRYNFCSNCGTPLDASSDPPHCNKCGITYYRNAKPCASVLPVKNGKVLLSRRGRDPFKGAYDIIGGFMDVNELPEAAALREAKEETNLDMKIVALLGIYTDQYGEDGDYTLNLHYIAEIIGGDMQAQDDVADLEWVAIDEVPLHESFQNTRDGLRDLQKWHKENKK
jgi:ADP-ribose pyrophosphatase YjhB (NUDIX family)